MKQNRSNTKTAVSRKKSDSGSTVRATRLKTGANKMSENVTNVLPLGNGWVVKASNANTFTAITDSKTEAISIARTLARTKHTIMIVHGRSGAIEIQEDYIG